MKKKQTLIMVSPEFKKKLMYESKVVRGITMMEYTRQLAASDKDVKSLLNDSSDVKLSEKKVRRGFDFGF